MAIAAVLGSLDDKIELLREQNETLEALAQTLFKRWFIDFNFPDKNGNPYKNSSGKMIASELGEIPEGWKVGNFEDDGFCLTMGQSPSSSSYNEDDSGTLFSNSKVELNSDGVSRLRDCLQLNLVEWLMRGTSFLVCGHLSATLIWRCNPVVLGVGYAPCPTNFLHTDSTRLNRLPISLINIIKKELFLLSISKKDFHATRASYSK